MRDCVRGGDWWMQRDCSRKQVGCIVRVADFRVMQPKPGLEYNDLYSVSDYSEEKTP